jgi:hypothetical protein
MLLFAVSSGFFPVVPTWLAGSAGWVAAMLLIGTISRGQQMQIGFLFLVGIVALLVSVYLGGSPNWVRLLDANGNLLTMIAAISFLRLVTITASADAQMPVGIGAYRRTLVGVGLFGSFINMSAPILILDRLAQVGPIPRFTSQSVTRVFSGCSSWSPFFGGMAVVLTYIPSAELLFLMLACLPFAVIGFLVVNLEATIRFRDQMKRFQGYPMSFANLWVPILLAIFVFAGRMLIPDVSILLVIALAAVGVTVVVLLVRHGFSGSRERLGSHISNGLTAMGGELLLFSCAGVLAVGLAALVDVGGFSLPIATYTPWTAVAVLGLMQIASMCGVHPIISIAALTPILMPINPPSHLLAVTFLLGWSIGTCSSPLSGTHVIFQGRYGIPAVKAAVANWPFAMVMFVVAIAILHGVDYVR